MYTVLASPGDCAATIGPSRARALVTSVFSSEEKAQNNIIHRCYFERFLRSSVRCKLNPLEIPL